MGVVKRWFASTNSKNTKGRKFRRDYTRGGKRVHENANTRAREGQAKGRNGDDRGTNLNESLLGVAHA